MFLLNSRLTRFSVAGLNSSRKVTHLLPAPLLPKLRGHFAEFLLRNSLEHLRLLASPTCVGLRYGRHMPSSAKLFSAVCVRSLEVTEVPLVIGSRLPERICLSGNAYHLSSESTI